MPTDGNIPYYAWSEAAATKYFILLAEEDLYNSREAIVQERRLLAPQPYQTPA